MCSSDLVATGLKKDGTSAMRRTLMLYVNESGFYALVLGSKLPTAVKYTWHHREKNHHNESSC